MKCFNFKSFLVALIFPQTGVGMTTLCNARLGHYWKQIVKKLTPKEPTNYKYVYCVCVTSICSVELGSIV